MRLWSIAANKGRGRGSLGIKKILSGYNSVVEYLVANETVVGSNPTTRSKFKESVLETDRLSAQLLGTLLDPAPLNGRKPR